MKTVVVLNERSIRAILQGREGGVTADLERRGEAISAAAGTPTDVETWVGRNRVRVTVRTSRAVPRHGRAGGKYTAGERGKLLAAFQAAAR